MTRSYRFIQVDVFTDRPFGGNQLAVFTDGRGLSAEEMQILAREMNFSESTIVLPPEAPGALKRVRIFTPAAEMPMAGHPAVGTAWVLAQHGEIAFTAGAAEAVLELGIGPVRVDVEGSDRSPEFVWMTHRDPVFGETRNDRTRVGRALGISGDDIRADQPMQVVSTGVPYLYVPLRSLQSIGRCRPNQAALADLYDGSDPVSVLLFTTETTSPEARVHARMFTPDAGDRPEDPATGSAAAPLGAYLARYGLLPDDELVRFVCEQGLEMKRPSRIHVEVRRRGEAITGLRIGGQAVIVGEGTIFWD